MTHHAALFADCRCLLGEGIIWWPRHRALLWTDIEASRLWLHDEAGSRSWQMPARLGSMAACASGALLLGLEDGLYRADFDPRQKEDPHLVQLVSVEADQPSTRVNDGRTDRQGNFVFGTMNQAEGHPATGSFYQWSSRFGLRRLGLPRVGIANSICFSPDGGTMYFCDSPRARIMACAYDAATARVSEERAFASLGPGQGLPDGSIVDDQGCLWNAVWGAGLVRRYRPDGTLDRELGVPAKNPTCAIFGGSDMNELFITTARQEMSAEELERVPDAGGVYRARITDVRGLLDPAFAD